MKCNICGSEWTAKNLVISICPFCGAELDITDVRKTNQIQSSADAISFIYNQYGVDLILSPKLKSYITDIAPKLPQNIKSLIGMVYDFGAADKIRLAIAGSEKEKQLAIIKATKCLTDFFVTEEAARKIISEITLTMGWPQPDYPSSIKQFSSSNNTSSSQSFPQPFNSTQSGNEKDSSSHFYISSTNNLATFSINNINATFPEKKFSYVVARDMADNYPEKYAKGQKSFSIPDGYTYICKNSLEPFIDINRLIIPDSVNYIEKELFTDCKACRYLEQIIISDNNPKFWVVNGKLREKDTNNILWEANINNHKAPYK